MKDQDIYKEIGQILFNESPNIENEVHLVCKVLKHSVAQHVWFGNTGRVKENIFKFSRENAMTVSTLSLDLKKFFIENNLGDWNIFYYKLLVKENRFETKFEFSEGIDDGTLAFWKYVQRFDPK